MKQTRAVAHLRVNGTETPFTLDSGASYSVLTDAAAAWLNLDSHLASGKLSLWGVTGLAKFRVASIERLGLQGSEIKNVDILVGGNEPGAGTMGLLGLDILNIGRRDTEYDLANGVVRLISPNADCVGTNLAYWAGTTPVVELPLIGNRRGRFSTIKANASINGKSVRVVFDTGALSLLSLDAAKRVGLVDDETRLQPLGRVFGIGRGERPSWTVQVESFELGTERITNSRLRVADIVSGDYDMLIGIDFFLSHRIYVAQSQDRMFFTYGGGPVFDLSQKMAKPATANADDAGAPQDAAGLARRGAAFAVRGEPMLALADLDRAVELAPTVAAYRVQRAQVRLSQRQRDAGLADLEEALRLDPQADEARLELARQRLAGGATDSARADLQVLDSRVAPQSNLRRQMGDLFFRLKEPLLALRQYDQWVDAHPNEADLYVVLNSRCWMRALANTQLDKALNDCNESLDAKPKTALYLQSRGLVYLRQGHWKKAIADYDAALALNPRMAWSLWGRGLAYLQSGARDQGQIDIAAAKTLRPEVVADAHRYGLDVPVLGDKPMLESQ